MVSNWMILICILIKSICFNLPGFKVEKSIDY